VFWYPWGPEALERARAENKPIFLSIGYSTCYWCHVMEREIFENLSFAAQMNRFFINIKVDREEHPALDDYFMLIRHLMTGEGGWPNNIFLTPDLKPIHAGGTFSATDSQSRPAFPRVLEWVNYEWITNPSQVNQKGEGVIAEMQPYLVHTPPAASKAADLSAVGDMLFATFQRAFDYTAGGFFQAPKFPHETYLQFLLDYNRFTGKPEALQMLTHTLQQIAAGGIYDHVGCGFHRYAIDKQWLVPHFEKMLYNQAQLARLYTDAACVTGNAYFADIARSVLDFVGGPLTDSLGAFYTAIDAESSGVEGAYYVWTPEEIQSVLSPEEAQYFVTFFALADVPTFDGHPPVPGKVIMARRPLDIAAHAYDMPYVEMAAMAGHVFNKLLAARNQREAPILDNKIIVAWNGLMIDAYANAGRVFSRGEYITRATKAAYHLLNNALDNDGELKRIIVNGHAGVDATLEDYAYLVKGLLTLHRAAPDEGMLDAALGLMESAHSLFADTNGGGYFFSANEEKGIYRIKSADDSAMPSPNAAMLHNWIDLFELTQDEAHLKKAQTVADAFLRGREEMFPELSAMASGALRLHAHLQAKSIPAIRSFIPEDDSYIEAVQLDGGLAPESVNESNNCELQMYLNVKEGWYLSSVELAVQETATVRVKEYKNPEKSMQALDSGDVMGYSGQVLVSAIIEWPAQMATRPQINAEIRFQTCKDGVCYKERVKGFSV
jgi:uncharacterized protein YyaL (SSP411 family)